MPGSILIPPETLSLAEGYVMVKSLGPMPVKGVPTPVEVYEVARGRRIFARRREDGKWLFIPSRKVERNRDSPDGRNHLCAPPPGAMYLPDTVFCFALGSGI